MNYLDDEDDAYNEYANYRLLEEEEHDKYLNKKIEDEYFNRFAHDLRDVSSIIDNQSYCIGNAVQHLLNFKHSNNLSDLEQAIDYTNREIKRLYGK